MSENKWIKKVKEYHSKHPELSYKECLVKLSTNKQKGGKSKVGFRTMVLNPEEELKYRSQNGKGTNPSALAQRGGNPALLALAQNSGQISEALDSIINGITTAVDKQQERGFEKNKLTGWYDMRKRFKNERVIEDKTIDLFNRYRKLRDKGKFPKWSDDKIWEYASQNS